MYSVTDRGELRETLSIAVGQTVYSLLLKQRVVLQDLYLQSTLASIGVRLVDMHVTNVLTSPTASVVASARSNMVCHE